MSHVIDYSNDSYDVIVVGAGLSGLVAGHKILSKEPTLKILVLEAATRIGGQIMSWHEGELGARTVADDHHHIRKLCGDLNISLESIVVGGEQTISGSGQLKRSWQIDEGFFAKLARFEVRRFIDYCDLISRIRGRLCDLILKNR